MNTVKLIYPYYENPGMLERQVQNWNRYAGELRANVQIVLVDDGSPKNPALPIFKECKIPKVLYRVKENIPWNQHGARNLGAKVASKEDVWLFMSDMDIILTAETAFSLFEKKLSGAHHYTMERTFAPTFTERKYHCNTFLVRRAVYWQVNGYDEDYCGTYGGDGAFLRQIDAIAPRRHFKDIVLLGYPDTVVPDANTREWERVGEMKDEYRRRFDAKRKSGDERSKNPIRFEWERLL